MNDKKILVFSPYYPPHIGGLESHADEFNKHISQKGFSITVFTPRLPISAPEHEIIHNNVSVYRFPAFEIISNYPLPKFWEMGFWRISKKVFDDHFDIVISRTRFFITTSFLAMLYAKTKKAKWVHIEHGSDFVKLNNKFTSLIARLYDLTLGRATIALADIIIANSEASARFCKKLYQKDCHVIYRGVEAEKIIRQEANNEALHHCKNNIVVTFIGRLIDGKGVSDLLTAIAQIQKENIKVFIIGDGPQRQKLEQLCKNLQISNKVVFFGRKNFSETIGLLKISDIFVNPSYTEGLPTSVIEAALCKKAIIATDVGGTPEIIADGENGLLFKAKSITALVSSLNKLIDNEDLRKSFGEKAFSEARNKFNWDNSAEKYLEIFNHTEI